jgi:hypothetical protein
MVLRKIYVSLNILRWLHVNKENINGNNLSSTTAYRNVRRATTMLCKDPLNIYLRHMYVKMKKLYRKTVKLQKGKYCSELVSKLNNLCENETQVY